MLGLAAIRGVSVTGLDAFTASYARTMSRDFADDPERTREKLELARERYGVVVE